MDESEVWCMSIGIAKYLHPRLTMWLKKGVMGYPPGLGYNEWLTILTKMRDGFLLIAEDDETLWEKDHPNVDLAEEACTLLGEYLQTMWD